jgi:hypothetical protein
VSCTYFSCHLLRCLLVHWKLVSVQALARVYMPQVDLRWQANFRELLWKSIRIISGAEYVVVTYELVVLLGVACLAPCWALNLTPLKQSRLVSILLLASIFLSQGLAKTGKSFGYIGR